MGHSVSLSPRQAQVARLLVEGLTQEQISERLEITPRTVWHHVAIIRSKTGTTTTAAAVSRLRARDLGPRSGDTVETI